MKKLLKHPHVLYTLLLIGLMTSIINNSHAQNSLSSSGQPYIHIITPSSNGLIGTTWLKGSVQSIKWKDNITNAVQIELYRGTTSITTIAAHTPSDGSFAYLVPHSLSTAYNYRIKITDVNDPSVFDWSDYFSVDYFPGSITVTNPTASTVWTKSQTHSIGWTDNISNDVSIKLYRGATLVETIATSTPSDGYYSYTVPPTLINGSNYRIYIADVSDPAVFDWSDSFTVSNANTGSINVTYPNNSTNWDLGQERAIRWSSNISGNVRIELYKNNNLRFTIATNALNNGRYDYTMPFSLSTGSDYHIKITSVSNPMIFGISEEFTISTANPDPNGSIEVHSPDSGDVWILGQTYPIIWSDNINENVQIRLIYSGTLNLNITASTQSDGLYFYTVPTNLGVGRYKVKITSVAHPTIYAQSGIFHIAAPPNQQQQPKPNNALGISKSTSITTLTAAPNPQTVGQTAKIVVETSEANSAQMVVTDITGKIILEQSINLIKGNNQVTITPFTTKGLYTVSIQTATDQKSINLLIIE